MMLYGLVSP